MYSIKSVSMYVCGWADKLKDALICQMREGWQRKQVKWEIINRGNKYYMIMLKNKD